MNLEELKKQLKEDGSKVKPDFSIAIIDRDKLYTFFNLLINTNKVEYIYANVQMCELILQEFNCDMVEFPEEMWVEHIYCYQDGNRVICNPNMHYHDNRIFLFDDQEQLVICFELYYKQCGLV